MLDQYGPNLNYPNI